MRELGDTADDIIEALACLKDSKGLTPLHLACIKGHADAVGVLMDLGANPFAMVRPQRSSSSPALADVVQVEPVGFAASVTWFRTDVGMVGSQRVRGVDPQE